MSPLVVCPNAPASAVDPTWVKLALVIVGAVAVPGESSGTDKSRYQGVLASGAPALHIPNDVVPTSIVLPPRPVAVVQAAAVAGGGQKPTFGSMVSPKAETDRAKSKTTSRVANRVIGPPLVIFQDQHYDTSILIAKDYMVLKIARRTNPVNLNELLAAGFVSLNASCRLEGIW